MITLTLLTLVPIAALEAPNIFFEEKVENERKQLKKKV